MNYAQTLDYLYSQLPMFQRMGAAAYKADLNNTYAILKVLNDPHKKFRSIHIAGTNGKGSVSHMIASVLQESGLKTGLYTSPHLKDFRERIMINGNMIEKDYVVSFVEKYGSDFEKIKPSFFEMTVGMAFKYFEEQQLDIAVIEVGMGGRLDSTNVIIPELSVITNISFDHTQFLGDSFDKIAKEKAEIIKPDIPVVIGEYQEDTNTIFLEKAKLTLSDIYFADQNFAIESVDDISENNKKIRKISINRKGMPFLENLCLPLAGLYQLKNLITSIQAFEVLNHQGYSLSSENIQSGIFNIIENTGIKGRWQVLSHDPLIICDIGHNAEGIKNILNQISAINYRKLHFVMGLVNDKQIDKILELLPDDAEYYFCKADIPRGLDQKELQETALKYNLTGTSFKTVASALGAARQEARSNDLIFIGGSTFIVAEIL